MTLNIEELERVARSATQGEWRCVDQRYLEVRHPYSKHVPDAFVFQPMFHHWDTARGSASTRPQDALHIATFNPATALALIDVIKKALALREALSCTSIMPSNRVEKPLEEFDEVMRKITWKTFMQIDAAERTK